MPDLITVVIDNHIDNYHKDILAFVCYVSNVNNQPKNEIQGLIAALLNRININS